MPIVFDGEYGYDGFKDYLYVDLIDEMDSMDEKLEQIKSMYLRDPEAYSRWKQWCMNRNKLSDIFGTIDNPIVIDESKL